ncbi:MAG: type II toxin-antitoxin system RelE/ParE family toxin [Bacteroidales bacterium]|nr:type II toxin-antitoxin system RelE/ParE family toxin [Bacteroidales bacterium]
MKEGQYNIELSEEAENDFENSYQYYFSDSPKVANAFFQSVNTSLATIRSTPFSFPVVHKGLRKYTIKKFPFIIYYQVSNNSIKVLAIFHTSRDPRIWKKRVKE